MKNSPHHAARAARLHRIQDMLVTRLEGAMESLERQILPHKAPDNPLRTSLMRQAASRLGFWSCCGSNACLRARRCRRKPRGCVTACAPLVPPDLRASVIARLRAEWPDAIPFRLIASAGEKSII
jgi:hypothetical protein